MAYSHLITSDGSLLYDSDGNPIVIAIRDALEIECPPDISITTPYSTSPIVTFPDPTITGGVAPYSISYSPASGSTFTVGTTTVTCTVTDDFGETAECSFTVTVTVATPAGCTTGLSNEFNR